ncbi:AMIN-like domain-containing (lipo)protein [Geodermatophilus sp. SYSU D01105]
MTRRATALVCPPLLLAVTLLAGCAEAQGGSSTSGSPVAATSSVSASTATATTAPEDETEGETGGEDATDEDASSDAPSFPADTEPDTQDASADARGTVSEIRTGRQDGFDRVVFEVGGTGSPGWDVRYVDEASSQGSGAPVELEGEAVLQVTLTGMGYPYDTGVEEWAGPDPLPGSGTQVVTEVAWDATFEGTSVAFIGTTARAPFRVYALESPTRVVVDLRDAG